MDAGGNRHPRCVVGLGEALFDCFPERSVLGGAPVNAVVHASALLRSVGGEALPATRIGSDELGERFVREMLRRGVPRRAVQRDPSRATGRVDVRPGQSGEPSYEFAAGVAWDALEFDSSWRALASACDAVVFGTLAQRSSASAEAIGRFLETATQSVRLFDVNLRGEFWSADVLDRGLRLATAAKCNEDELAVVSDAVGLSESEPRERVAALCETYRLEWFALTRGSAGTAVCRAGEWHERPVSRFTRLPEADNVGAGDACSAGLLAGALVGYSIDETLDLANGLGAFVASQPGATPTLPVTLSNGFARLARERVKQPASDRLV